MTKLRLSITIVALALARCSLAAPLSPRGVENGRQLHEECTLKLDGGPDMWLCGEWDPTWTFRLACHTSKLLTTSNTGFCVSGPKLSETKNPCIELPKKLRPAFWFEDVSVDCGPGHWCDGTKFDPEKLSEKTKEKYTKELCEKVKPADEELYRTYRAE